MDAMPPLNEVIHAPRRLAVCAFLYSVDRAEFSTLREAMGVSDSVLSKHVSVLVRAGYVEVYKISNFGRQHTWLSLTRSGQRAYDEHVDALRDLLRWGPKEHDAGLNASEVGAGSRSQHRPNFVD